MAAYFSVTRAFISQWVGETRPCARFHCTSLANVYSAPWDKVKVQFEKIGYSAAHQRVDTKIFYIPHTRTHVYLIAVNEKKSSLPEKWLKTVGNLKCSFRVLWTHSSGTRETRE